MNEQYVNEYIQLSNKYISLFKYKTYDNKQLRQSFLPPEFTDYLVFGCDRLEDEEQVGLCIGILERSDNTVLVYTDASPVLDQALSEINDTNFSARFIPLKNINNFNYILLLDFYLFFNETDRQEFANLIGIHTLVPFTELANDPLENMILGFYESNCTDKEKDADPYAFYVSSMDIEEDYLPVIKENRHLRGIEKNAFIYGEMILLNKRYEAKLKALKSSHFKNLRQEQEPVKESSDSIIGDSYADSFLKAIK